MIKGLEVAIIDINSEADGVRAERLMENAGKGAADFIKEYVPGEGGDKNLLVISGLGNNGGDGLVAARYLKDVFRVRVLIAGDGAGDIKTKLSRMNYSRLKNTVGEENIDFYGQIKYDISEHIKWCDMIGDAMLGVGLQGKLREPYKSLVKQVNEGHRLLKKTVVAFDVPTGWGTDQHVEADTTVTFHDIKEGMDGVEGVHIINIGVPAEAVHLTGRGELLLYPGIKNQAGKGRMHKGQRGRLMIVGGGPYVGAPILASESALRTGVDLVYLASTDRVCGAASSRLPDIIPIALEGDVLDEEHFDKIIQAVDSYGITGLLLGGGMGKDHATAELTGKLMQEIDVPWALDADGLGHIPTALWDDLGPGVITPHQGEYNRIAQEVDTNLVLDPDKMQGLDSDIIRGKTHSEAEKVKRLAARLGKSVLLKGDVDLITDGNRLKLNPSGNIGMTVGGTGDVLAGIVGALVAMGLDPYDAGRLGAYINGYSGDIAWNHKRFGLLASDIPDYIPRVFFELDSV